jgi:hypothetical protein
MKVARKDEQPLGQSATQRLKINHQMVDFQPRAVGIQAFS